VRGRFDRFAATLDAGASIADSRVSVTIDVASVNTNDPDRDVHLRSTQFFSAELHPEIRFASNEVTGEGQTWKISGDLSLNGVTQPMTFEVEFHGIEMFPLDQKRHLGFSATGVIRRSVYGIELGLVPLSSNRLMLDDDVKIEIDVQFIEPEAIV
jgi:polyisoprenoid-binding protein YceI